MRYKQNYPQFDLGPKKKTYTTEQLPVLYEEWEYRAKQILAAGPFDYIAGGAGSEDTMRENRKAFLPWRIQPQMLKDVTKRDLTVTLLGQRFPSPFFLAPIGLQGVAHPDAELGTARAASDLRVPFIISTVSSRSIEDIANVMGNSPRWFQLYCPNDPDITASLLQRAEKAGCTVIVVTVDFPAYAWRPRNIRNNYFPFTTGEGIANFISDPVFRAKLKQPPEKDMQAAISFFLRIFSNPDFIWNDLVFLRKHTKLPILLKGILHPKDAEMALRYGVDGIIVSNHGGRQLDGAIAALDALPTVCDIVRGRIPVLMDSGIRGGADVIKALALGATAVLLGRPYIYGLAVAGEKGVKQVLTNLLSDIDVTMVNSGRKSISEIDRSLLERVSI